jgi:hypothetical protein
MVVIVQKRPVLGNDALEDDAVLSDHGARRRFAALVFCPRDTLTQHVDFLEAGVCGRDPDELQGLRPAGNQLHWYSLTRAPVRKGCGAASPPEIWGQPAMKCTILIARVVWLQRLREPRTMGRNPPLALILSAAALLPPLDATVHDDLGLGELADLLYEIKCLRVVPEAECAFRSGGHHQAVSKSGV